MPWEKTLTILRPDLHSYAQEFIEEQSLIGLDLFPVFDVEEEDGKYPIAPVEALLNVPETCRAPRANYPRDDWEFEMGEYDTAEQGIEEPVDDVEAKQLERFFDSEVVGTQRTINAIILGREKSIATTLFDPANFTPHEVATEWSNPASTPILDILLARIAVHNACGIDPDTLVVTSRTFDNLRLNTEVLERTKYNREESIRLTPEIVANVLNVKRVLIGSAVYNVAKKGQEASLSQIWSDEYAMLCVTSEGKDIKSPCIGRTFRWSKDCPENILVESYREEAKRCTVIRCRQHMDEKVMLTACGYLFTNITE